jgi:hypothetical protein
VSRAALPVSSVRGAKVRGRHGHRPKRWHERHDSHSHARSPRHHIGESAAGKSAIDETGREFRRNANFLRLALTAGKRRPAFES